MFLLVNFAAIFVLHLNRELKEMIINKKETIDESGSKY